MLLIYWKHSSRKQELGIRGEKENLYNKALFGGLPQGCLRSCITRIYGSPIGGWKRLDSHASVSHWTKIHNTDTRWNPLSLAWGKAWPGGSAWTLGVLSSSRKTNKQTGRPEGMQRDIWYKALSGLCLQLYRFLKHKTRQKSNNECCWKETSVRRLREIREKETRGEGLVCHILVGLSQLPAIPSLQNPPKNSHPGMPLSIYSPEWALFVWCSLGIFVLFSYCSHDNIVGWILSSTG